MLKRINDALPGLVFGIVFYGIVVQLIGVWFVTDKISYSIGLWYGIAIAVGIAVNIATVIYGQKDANRRIVAKSLLRYIVVAVLLFILGLFNFGNLIMAFVGMLGLKISAYLQPLFMKVTDRFSGRSDASSAGEMETE
jgi:vacuolar-type H+-ATPase subunit I/STV1